MKRTTQGLLTTTIWIGLLTAGQSVMGQASPAVGEPATPTNTPAPANQPEPDRLQTDSDQEPSDSVLDHPNPTAVVETSAVWDGGVFGNDLPGPCCAICGGGNGCPADWYVEQGVRVLTRSRARGKALSVEAPPVVFSIFNVAFGLVQVQFDDDATPEDDALFQVVNRTLPTLDGLGTSELSPDIAAGYRATVGRYLGRDTNNRDQFLEFTFWGMNAWTEAKTLNGELRPLYDETLQYDTTQALRIQNGLDLPDVGNWVGNLTSFFQVITDDAVNNQIATADDRALSTAFNNAELHSSVYYSRIDNFELNARIRPRNRAAGRLVMQNDRWQRECEPGTFISYLFGARALSIDERFDFYSRGGRFNAVNNSPVLDYVATGNYLVRTHNDLLGIQFGMDFINRRCKWMYGVRVKAGPFVNFSDQFSDILTQTAGDPLATPQLAIHRQARHDGAALVGEVGFVGSYKIRPNFSVRASYDFMWVTGLALAPEQLQFETNPEARVNTNGHIYYHGLTLGAEWIW